MKPFDVQISWLDMTWSNVKLNIKKKNKTIKKTQKFKSCGITFKGITYMKMEYQRENKERMKQEKDQSRKDRKSVV